MSGDGGPAFPVTAGQQVYSHGMLLRDWFAGQALIAGQRPSGQVRDDNSPTGWKADPRPWAEQLAEHCYQIADAMLAARERDDG